MIVLHYHHFDVLPAIFSHKTTLCNCVSGVFKQFALVLVSILLEVHREARHGPEAGPYTGGEIDIREGFRAAVTPKIVVRVA